MTITVDYNYLRGRCREDFLKAAQNQEKTCCNMSHSDYTSGKKPSILRVEKYCHRCPRGSVVSPPLEILRI